MNQCRKLISQKEIVSEYQLSKYNLHKICKEQLSCFYPCFHHQGNYCCMQHYKLMWTQCLGNPSKKGYKISCPNTTCRKYEKDRWGAFARISFSFTRKVIIAVCSITNWGELSAFQKRLQNQLSKYNLQKIRKGQVRAFARISLSFTTKAFIAVGCILG